MSNLLHTIDCAHWSAPGVPCDCGPIIHATAVIGDPPEHRDQRPGDNGYSPFIGCGSRLNAFVTVDSGTTRSTYIGSNVLLMAHCHVGHDCIVRDGCELAAGTVLAGRVELGRDVRVGVNACFRPRVKVGDGARIGAGAVVVNDVPAGETWVGNPAREINRARSDMSLFREAYSDQRSALELLREAQ